MKFVVVVVGIPMVVQMKRNVEAIKIENKHSVVRPEAFLVCT